MRNNLIITALVFVTCAACRHTSDSVVFASAPEPILASTKNQAPARALHTALWTGDAMLVWGGLLDGQKDVETTDGAAYYPASDRWFNIPKAEKYSRFFHSAVWTGDQMIVWGGLQSHSNDVLGDGLAFDLSSETWQTVAQTDAPAARSGHTAVWTGEQMLVFGGQDGEHYFGNGGAYEPEDRMWLNLNTDGAPSERAFHSAVWTGSQMIVWGGTNAKTYLNTGALYDPATGKWTPMATAHAPSPRLSATVVWTGKQMIVWGGRSPKDEYKNDGAIYDPATNKWTTINVSEDSPSARELHTAVWTGKQMIVWGGHDAAGTRKDAAVFDPKTMSWDNFVTSKAVASRYMHTAVWTGNSVLVFGGRANNNKLVQKKICVQLPLDGEAVAPVPATPVASINEPTNKPAAAKAHKRS